jgi:hypothetical protein
MLLFTFALQTFPMVSAVNQWPLKGSQYENVTVQQLQVIHQYKVTLSLHSMGNPDHVHVCVCSCLLITSRELIIYTYNPDMVEALKNEIRNVITVTPEFELEHAGECMLVQMCLDVT